MEQKGGFMNDKLVSTSPSLPKDILKKTRTLLKKGFVEKNLIFSAVLKVNCTLFTVLFTHFTSICNGVFRTLCETSKSIL